MADADTDISLPTPFQPEVDNSVHIINAEELGFDKAVDSIANLPDDKKNETVKIKADSSFFDKFKENVKAVIGDLPSGNIEAVIDGLRGGVSGDPLEKVIAAAKVVTGKTDESVLATLVGVSAAALLKNKTDESAADAQKHKEMQEKAEVRAAEMRIKGWVGDDLWARMQRPDRTEKEKSDDAFEYLRKMTGDEGMDRERYNEIEAELKRNLGTDFNNMSDAERVIAITYADQNGVENLLNNQDFLNGKFENLSKVIEFNNEQTKERAMQVAKLAQYKGLLRQQEEAFKNQPFTTQDQSYTPTTSARGGGITAEKIKQAEEEINNTKQQASNAGNTVEYKAQSDTSTSRGGIIAENIAQAKEEINDFEIVVSEKPTTAQKKPTDSSVTETSRMEKRSVALANFYKDR